MNKPILCLDFDGVIHSYTSGWKGADVVPDPPVPGAVEFIQRAVQDFTVAIYSSRSGQNMGVEAMQFWLKIQFYRLMDAPDADAILAQVQWPTEKPPALVTIDDRALTFSGNWSDYDCAALLAFKPWNKRLAQGTSAFGQDAQRLEAKPAGPVPQGCAPTSPPSTTGDVQ